MKKIIIITILCFLLLLIGVNAQVYVLELNKIGPHVVFSSIVIRDEQAPAQVSINDSYSATLVKSDSSIIYSTSFVPPERGIFQIKLPYVNNANKIIIKDNEKETRLEIPVTTFSNVCEGENCIEGPLDESIIEEIQDETLEEAEEKNQEEVKEINETQIKEETEEKIIEEDYEEFEELSEDYFIDQPPHIPSQKNTFSGLVGFLLVFFVIIILIFGIIIYLGMFKSKPDEFKQLKNYFNNYMQRGYSPEQIASGLEKNGYDKDLIEKVKKSILK